MARRVKCFVEIHCKKDEFIAFDFGCFAILFIHRPQRGNKINIYFDNAYTEEFSVFFESSDDNDYRSDSMQISYKDFQYIKGVSLRFLRREEEIYCKELYSFLRKNFPKQIKFYGA